MITQYSWASVRKQERRYIEIGAMISLMLAIVTFYAVPNFGPNAPVFEEFTAPLIEVYEIPATVQTPERIKPQTPALPEPVEEPLEIDDPLVWVLPPGGMDGILLTPPVVDAPILRIWMVKEPPVPVGGYAAILANITYPEIAREAGIEGRVVVEALIGVNGIVESAIILEGVPRTGLNEAAIDAVLKTQFTPAFQMDKPVRVKMAIPIVFRLRKG